MLAKDDCVEVSFGMLIFFNLDIVCVSESLGYGAKVGSMEVQEMPDALLFGEFTLLRGQDRQFHFFSMSSLVSKIWKNQIST